MYEILVLDAAERDLRQLDRPIARRISRRIDWLAENLDQIKPEQLTGELSRFFKLRVGDYRVIYRVIREERLVVIHRIGIRLKITSNQAGRQTTPQSAPAPSTR